MQTKRKGATLKRKARKRLKRTRNEGKLLGGRVGGGSGGEKGGTRKFHLLHTGGKGKS